MKVLKNATFSLLSSLVLFAFWQMSSSPSVSKENGLRRKCQFAAEQCYFPSRKCRRLRLSRKTMDCAGNVSFLRSSVDCDS